MWSKMAEAKISVAKDQLRCSVCLDLLKEPVTIPCGHSYCMNCITDFWNKDHQRRGYSCPQCRQTFSPRPALNKNVMLAEMVDNLKKTRTALSYAGPGDVECDVCTGRKRKAVKSCLVCLDSYCQTHFECHEESRSSKRHKLTDAGRFQKMICPKHDRLLEVFCRTDKRCVCFMCVMDEHKNHDTVSAEAERTEKQNQVGEIKGKCQQRIQEKQKQLQELKETIKTHKSSAKVALEHSERIFTELIRSIERSRSEVTQIIKNQEKAEVSRAEGLLEPLQQEIDDLKRRDAELEQLLLTDDHINFLQSFQSLSEPLESTGVPRVAVSPVLLYDDVRRSVSQLKGILELFFKEKIERIFGRVTYINIFSNNEPRTREEFLQYSHQLTLDPNTLHKQLCLSEEKRVATYTQTEQPYPDHPDRFDHWPQVLCRERVYGRCYWEVEWSGGVGISVSYKTICRKGETKDCLFGYNNQSWKLQYSQSCHLFLHNNIKTKLPVFPSSCRVGVYVDHRAGILSFYSVSDTMTLLIHSVQTTFTQPLYPGFWLDQGSSIKLCRLTK
ncbi:tripartite motif-containing protein 16-like protein isoform X2 [Carassius gibelio]|uniref:tripartite motif-containing protein 16-like protein isoform X2 n=1 Tax=Carassius gibelio TaxID=101364 RepID=UPI002277721D|nr:tripartite motif-containing protein 16-like protein isoform X2 [Carassius gibelio]